MPKSHTHLFATPGRFRPLISRTLWAGGFLGVYGLGLAVFGSLGLPLGAVPLLAGAATAGGFTLLARKRRLASMPSPAHLRAVDRVSREMDGVTDPEELAEVVVAALRRALRPGRIYFWLADRDRRDYQLAAGCGLDLGTTSLPEPWVQEFFQFLATDETQGADLPARGGEFSRWLAASGLGLCLPILSNGRMIGMLTVGDKESGQAYTAGDRWLLNQMLRHSGLALSYLGLQKEDKRRRSRMDNLTHLYKDAQQRAITDGLTGLATHLYFQEQLHQRFNEARRHGSALSVVLVDIDHFKGFNDTFGHPMGDQVLREVASTVKKAARTCDTVARYGGEELALVLPQTPLAGAVVMGERIREAIEAIALTDAKGRRLPPITASVGVAQLEAGDLDTGALVERADAGLYKAKRQGRNQVCLAS